jgi:hypothetical protein
MSPSPSTGAEMLITELANEAVRLVDGLANP